MEKIRTFIAIRISDEILAALASFIHELKAIHRGVKWVRPESVHLTLKFLGDVSIDKLPDVFTAVERACQGIAPFNLKISGKGAFPSLKKPRVFWVGLAEPENSPLKQLQSAVEGALNDIGYPKEDREFKPHLTIGRVKDARKTEDVCQLFLDYSFPALAFDVKSVEVMKSQLTPQGAIYTVQKSIPFTG